jgi:HK97 family phage major capsid protein
LLKRKVIMNIQALREHKNELARQANAILAAAGDKVWSADDKAKYDGIMDNMGRLNDQIKAFQDQLDADADSLINNAANMGRKPSASGEQKVRDLFAQYLRENPTNMTPETAHAIRAAMSTTTPAEGGYTVPSVVVPLIIDALKAFGGMRSLAKVITTENGVDYNYPGSDGTGEVGEWVGQNQDATQGDITFTNVLLATYMASSKKIPLPVQLIQDSAIDVVAFVIDRLATRIGRLTNAAYTAGDGSGKPYGLINRATVGKTGTTGQTASVIYDDFVDLLHSVNSEYRKRGTFQMADSSLKVVRKLKDTTGRPIFTPSYESGITQGAPDLLLGKPLVINDDMPAMAANAYPIAFGDHSLYMIRDVASSMSIRRFDDSAFALKGQVGFCGWMRTGGNLLDTAAVKTYRNSAT